MREKAAALVREAARLLIAGESEAQRAAATHALGQLRPKRPWRFNCSG